MSHRSALHSCRVPRVLAILWLVLLAVPAQAIDRAAVWHRGIHLADFEVSGAPRMLEEVGVRVDRPGTFLVTFDGQCLSYPDDPIHFLLLSDRDQALGQALGQSLRQIQAIDGDVPRGHFSATLHRAVGPGHFTFQAYAQIPGGAKGVADDDGRPLVSVEEGMIPRDPALHRSGARAARREAGPTPRCSKRPTRPSAARSRALPDPRGGRRRFRIGGAGVSRHVMVRPACQAPKTISVLPLAHLAITPSQSVPSGSRT